MTPARKRHAIEEQLRACERRLRMEALKSRLRELEQAEEYNGGHLPTIHVPVGILAASQPIERRVAAD